MAQVVELPASQVRSPDFKLQYHKKKKKKKTINLQDTKITRARHLDQVTMRH
jgi:hypothetical protein